MLTWDSIPRATQRSMLHFAGTRMLQDAEQMGVIVMNGGYSFGLFSLLVLLFLFFHFWNDNFPVGWSFWKGQENTDDRASIVATTWGVIPSLLQSWKRSSGLITRSMTTISGMSDLSWGFGMFASVSKTKSKQREDRHKCIVHRQKL